MKGILIMILYKYVSIKGEQNKLTGAVFFTDHQAAIDEWAAKGFRYHSNIPTKFISGGSIIEYDLIFEQVTED